MVVVLANPGGKKIWFRFRFPTTVPFSFLLFRMIKEVDYYKEEVKENEAKLAKMKANNQDPYDIKKFEEVLGESYMMVPDSSTRLKQTLEDLASYIESSEVTDDLKGSDWYKQAVDLLEQEKSRYEDKSDVLEETKVDDLAEGEAF